MLCKIVKQDESWYEPNEVGWSKMPAFGRGESTWYRLIDNGLTWKEDGQICRYGLRKSWIYKGEYTRDYSSIPIQDHEAKHLLDGNVLGIDGDSIQLDRRTKAYRNQ